MAHNNENLVLVYLGCYSQLLTLRLLHWHPASTLYIEGHEARRQFPHYFLSVYTGIGLTK